MQITDELRRKAMEALQEITDYTDEEACETADHLLEAVAPLIEAQVRARSGEWSEEEYRSAERKLMMAWGSSSREMARAALDAVRKPVAQEEGVLERVERLLVDIKHRVGA